MLSRRTTVLALCSLAVTPLLPRIAVAQSDDWRQPYRERIKLAPLPKNCRNGLINTLDSCSVSAADELLKRNNIR